uniref:Carcinin n=1 Tax=Macrobrachium nipponense TaxID=159736 RepID=A0A7G7FE30_MACNP|nr:carcinin [Macrobrachium nipponense]
MQGVKFLVLLVAVSSASACKYFCRKPGTFEYECCDNGNPYYTPDEPVTDDVEEKETVVTEAAPAPAPAKEQAVVAETCTYWCLVPNSSDYVCCDDGNSFIDEAATEVVPESEKKFVTFPPSNCYYYCAYDGKVYCCGDVSQPIPESHANHDGQCPTEEEQTCKSTGVYLISKKYNAKTSGAIRLASGPAKEQLTCASDGYCQEDEKCCPSHCARKHICLKALPEDDLE